MIAYCPKCHTQYTLTDEQLAMAQGQVRCGACMTIFQANAHQTKRNAQSQFVNEEPYSQPSNDLLDTDNFLDDFTETNSDAFGAFDAELNAQEGNEDWAKALLDELDSDISHELESTAPKEKNQPDQRLGVSSDDLDDLSDLDDLLTLKPEEHASLSSAFADSTQAKNHLRNRIEPEPIEFQYHRPRWFGMQFLSASLILLLLITAVGQLAFFKFDTLSKHVTWRPFYQTACTYLPCTVPARVDTDKISASHLTIKSHPYLNNILIADLILTNHATFDQPFPNLTLLFTNQEQQVITGRSIPPAVYLRGDIAQHQRLPQRQPVHIAIEIVDPGREATGYFIQVTAPPTTTMQTAKNREDPIL